MNKPLPFYSQLYNLSHLAVASVILIFCPAIASSQNTWAKKADFGGADRLYAISFSANHKGYMGLGTGAKNYNDIWAYDPATNTWSQKADYPGKGTQGVASFAVGDKGYVGTGWYTSVSGNIYQSDFYEYDPQKNVWTRKADYPGGAVWGAVGMAIGTKGYMGTGQNATAIKKDFYEYDPANDKWTRKADFGGDARGFGVAFGLNGKGYLGSGVQVQSYYKDFWEYNPTADKWTQKADIPPSSGYGNASGMAFSIGSKGYVGLGVSNGSFYEYDPPTDKWLERANPVPIGQYRDYVSGFSLDGKGYFGGGHFGATFKDFYEYTPCGDKNFTAEFDAVQSDLNVSFSAKIRSPNLRYDWDFGDGKKDTIFAALHTYSKLGNYKVKLIVRNTCYTDTLTKVITVKGLTSISTNRGGNSGVITANIIGAGFTSVYLSKGGSRIDGINLSSYQDGAAQVQFNLDQQSIGAWDVVAEFADKSTATLKNGFTIEDSIAPNYTLSIIGDNALRPGFRQIFTINYTNNGNIDALAIPLFIGGLPKGTKINLTDNLFEGSVPGYEKLFVDSALLPKTFTDSVTNTSYKLFIIKNIPANASGEIHVAFDVPADANNNSTANIVVALQESLLFGSPDPRLTTKLKVQSTANPASTAACLNAIMNDVIDNTLKSIVNLAKGPFKEMVKTLDVTGVTGCLSGLIGDQVGKYVTLPPKKGRSPELEIIEFTTNANAAFGTGLSCTAAILNGSAELVAADLAAPLVAVAGTVMVATKLVQHADVVLKIINKAAQCGDIFNVKAKVIKPVPVRASRDPNDLIGIGEPSSNHYTNGTKLNYRIGFENMATAGLNAQVVSVKDTLANSGFDLQSFAFSSVTIGNQTYQLPNPVKEFAHDFDFISQYNVKARVIATFDIITGIAEWKFYTINPKTNQITNDVLSGFLPPNKTNPEGQGYVGYSVNPVKNVGTGSTIKNQAFITFDYNPVIATNTWNNTFDFVAPKSKVDGLPTATNDSLFTVKWNGTDNLSGIQLHNVYYATNNGQYRIWQYNTTANSAVFKGQVDSTYKFYSIALDNAGNEEPAKTTAEATTTIRIPKVQTIKFTQLANKTFGDTDFDAGATATSALALTYVSTNTAVATIVNGKIHITGAGTTTLTASQGGNESWKPATNVSIQLTVNKGKQSMVFAAISAKNYQTADFAAGASASSGLAVTYTSSNLAVLTISGSNLHIAGPGKSTVKAWQPGNGNYLPSDTVSREVQVLFSLPANNFNLSTVSLSCRNSNNGEVHITASTSMAYTAKLTVNGASTTYGFANDLSVKNLSAGTYDVCITLAAYPGYQQCYTVIVEQPKDLSVYASVDNATGLLNLHLEGGNTFYVTLNGSKFTTTKKDLSLSLDHGKNTISVTTDQPCQGTFDDTINLPLGISTYPNPFTDQVSVTISNDNSATAAIEVYTLYGKAVYKDKKQVIQGKCTINLAALDVGMYILKVTTNRAEKRVKIYKK